MTKQNEQTTEKTVDHDHLLELPTKSAQIRYLDSQGLTRGQIAKTLGIRYQHVRNVLITPVKNPKV